MTYKGSNLRPQNKKSYAETSMHCVQPRVLLTQRLVLPEEVKLGFDVDERK